jgi:hypothetical protein
VSILLPLVLSCCFSSFHPFSFAFPFSPATPSTPPPCPSSLAVLSPNPPLPQFWSVEASRESVREVRPTYSSFSRSRRSATGNIVVLPVLFEQALHSDLVILYSIRLSFYSLQSVRPAGLLVRVHGWTSPLIACFRKPYVLPWPCRHQPFSPSRRPILQ